MNPTPSGVPQGSVLGLLLSLIYIDDVIRLYADDMLLYRKIDRPEDYTMLQKDINTINNRVKDNSLTFNVSKCNHTKGKVVGTHLTSCLTT